MNNHYTIVEPSFELFDPAEDTMLFLERCTRTCYKSEDKIGPGSAEKLLTNVVKNYKHLSVTEHANCILKIDCWHTMAKSIAEQGSLLRHTYNGDHVLVSGNIRMWKDLKKDSENCIYFDAIQGCLYAKWPFFFENPGIIEPSSVQLLDSNPITNKNNLSKEDMMKHMTLTGRFIGSRTMSHQLVRHRLAAYSQESQRYCNYGKKGFQFIVPPSITGDTKDKFISLVLDQFYDYEELLEEKIPPEDARFILPNATKTEVVATYTLDMWKHLIEHRARNKFSQWEIKDLCLEAEKQINSLLGWEIL